VHLAKTQNRVLFYRFIARGRDFFDIFGFGGYDMALCTVGLEDKSA
jgi:hypothetical protein